MPQKGDIMKLNGIKALDYQANNTKVVAALASTTLDEITDMDASLLRIETDDGALVEAFAGYRLVSVTYDTATAVFTAAFEQGAADTTAQALSAISDELVATKKENEALSAQVAEISSAIERGLAL